MRPISIRTPAWGVTVRRSKHLRRFYFNSHPRVGGDAKNARSCRLFHISIRTPAWGVTTDSHTSHPASHFNSHPRVGGDEMIYPCKKCTHISIRTPAWGVTAKIHKTVCNHLYIFAALCAFCSEITQQKTIIIRILKENTSIHCADLPENYARL